MSAPECQPAEPIRGDDRAELSPTHGKFLDADSAMTENTSIPDTSPPPKGSWRRFSLRALFLFVLAAGIFCGWVAYQARLLKRQYEWYKYHPNVTLKPLSNEWFWRPLVGDAAVTVRRIVIKRELDAKTFEWVKGWTEAEQLLLGGRHITDQSLRFVRGFDQLTLLALEDTAVTDAGTRHLAHLSGLKGLYVCHDQHGLIASPDITDAGLRNLVQRKDLDEFGVTGPITDEGLSMIVSHCPNLMSLRLDGSRITDKGLAALQRLKKLSYLSLTDNPLIDDAAALELAGVPSLRQIQLEGTRVTQKGAAAIRAKTGAWVTFRDPRGKPSR
jgi:hypothetical protein